MARLLYIECSPRKQGSASIQVCRAFLDAYRETHPADTIETLDIWNLPIPEFDGDAMVAKYASLGGKALTPAQASAWQRVEELAADRSDGSRRRKRPACSRAPSDTRADRRSGN